MIGSLILTGFALYFILKNNREGLLIIVVISLANDLFKFPFGFSLSIHHIVALLSFPKAFLYYKNNQIISKSISPLVLETIYLIFIAILLGFVFPWRSEVDYLRSWNQLSEGRALIQTFSLIADISLILMIYYWLSTGKVAFNSLINIFSWVIIISVLVAIVDFVLANRLKLFLFSEAGRDIAERFSGLNGEPRSLGRVCSVILLFLISFVKRNDSVITIFGIIFSIIGIIISLSASTYLVTLSWAVIIVVITKSYKHFVIALPLLLIVLTLSKSNEFFNDKTLYKIEKVVSLSEQNRYIEEDKVYDKEPEIFQRFEVFDRAALNFLYEEPLYLLFGTGPNLISIPSSPYLTRYAYSIYGNRIDSVPHTFFVNLLARSGIVGLILWITFIIQMNLYMRNSSVRARAFFNGLIVTFMIVDNTLFYMMLGIVVFILSQDFMKKINCIKKKKYAKYSDASS